MPILHVVPAAAANVADAANTNSRSLMPDAIRILSATFREMIAPQSASFHVVAVEGAAVTHRTARAGDNAVPSASTGDIIVEVGHDMDLEALARSGTLSDLVCSRIIGKVLHEREADARHAGVEGAFLFTSAAMLLLLSNRNDWRLEAGPNELEHSYLYDAILDYAFYRTYEEVDGRRSLQNLFDFETRVKTEKAVLERLVVDLFEDSLQGWYPLPHLTATIGQSVKELVERGHALTGQEIRPAPQMAAFA
ncbi:hypothetical protein [Methylobacterium fujisawaense]|jgi:hypothetical protein